MDALSNLLEAVIATDKNKAINTAIRNNSTEITDLNTKGQLLKGIDSTGDTFGLYHSVGYSLLKDSLAGRQASFGVVDLRLTGDFYKTFYVIARDTDDYFSIEADTIKEDKDLIVEYGQDILGLTEQSKDILNTKLIPDLINGFKKQIGTV